MRLARELRNRGSGRGVVHTPPPATAERRVTGRISGLRGLRRRPTQEENVLLSAIGLAIPQQRAARCEPRPTFPVTLYLVFAAGDLLFSLIAFSHGVAEANPVMAWLLRAGYFVPGK